MCLWWICFELITLVRFFHFYLLFYNRVMNCLNWQKSWQVPCDRCRLELHTYLVISVCVTVRLSNCTSVCLSSCLSNCPSVCQTVHLLDSQQWDGQSFLVWPLVSQVVCQSLGVSVRKVVIQSITLSDSRQSVSQSGNQSVIHCISQSNNQSNG